MPSQRILLIIGGGIAAYKCLDLIRRLRDESFTVRVVMTKAAHQFVTPLSVAALSNDQVYSDLFNLNDEREIGHIRLSREADLILVAPATADLLAKMAHGLADDLASTVLLASNKPILVAPAMNPKMWRQPATKRNRDQLARDGVIFIGPTTGEMAESNEAGPGRMAQVPELITAIKERLITSADVPLNNVPPPPDLQGCPTLRGYHVLVTAGPTHEPIDPVRYLANRSSGKQGYAIAAAAAAAGASVSLISGPTALPPPPGVSVHYIETAKEMLQAVTRSLPADIAIFTAAVADWRVASPSCDKIKKDKTRPGDFDSNSNMSAWSASKSQPATITHQLDLIENPDILRIVSQLTKDRPALVIGFAAETTDVLNHAKAKLASKGCDWIVANDVSVPPAPDGQEDESTTKRDGTKGVMGGQHNQVHIVTSSGVVSWRQMLKSQVATRLIAQVAEQVSNLSKPDP